ncbi:short-chain dehydrogenase [Burkholderia cepacia]|uniref:SDR family NAD(P)-dependent oxidoreductase n=1 Tax=Burkholderia cepacia TaxID=292 RepID=UPI00075BC062|nr:SDR family oxidoreductase [Burkholderia cepacia]KVA30580.1 short-chain dehydrogenase [Burkholderia cepacia]KVA42205.1 short-chain dehydrogenase [Burkholderia cepacia]
MAFVWICGATGAVGSALARRLDAKGVSMVLTARHAESLGALADTMSRERVVVAPADATDAAALDRALEAGVERFGVPDGLAHCVGSIVVKPMHSTSDSELHDAFAANYFSAWNALRAFVRMLLAAQAGGSAVLFGSVASRTGFPNHEAIASAKAAVGALAQVAAATYAARGIRVNCIHPGLIVSAMSARLTSAPQVAKRLADANPLGRLGVGDDPAALAAFLLSADASWVTGQQFGVDGGQGALIVSPRS